MKIHRASSLEEARKVRSERKADPIVVRANEHEVFVYVRGEEIINNIMIGNNWNTGFTADEDEHGYEMFVYTRLDEDQVALHLQDPTQFQGTD